MKFEKYHGTGNDFIIIDDRKDQFPESDNQYISKLCKRRFGIGADGLILIREHENVDFSMLYFNADGNIGSMCGNGGRCAVAFANKLGICSNNCRFYAFDGMHDADILTNGNIILSMNPPEKIQKVDDQNYILDTGSPHYVKFTDSDPGEGFRDLALKIRSQPEFRKNGINVNFVWREPSGFYHIRTFERGVEAETWSCGTGVTAAAIAVIEKDQTDIKNTQEVNSKVSLTTRGGNLTVMVSLINDKYIRTKLQGPATFVFSGYLPA